ncbi:hypothetical protein GOV10_03765, partial [Candidatus Woesearchaeota archaeon]|nr:hypothetical protein [Candidatus Woesearchaeota archaeon]
MLTAIAVNIGQFFIDFTIKYKVPLLFYLGIILLIYLIRKKLEWAAPLIGLYKTKVGINSMKYWSEKQGPFVRWLGLLGIGVGFTGMIFIVFTLLIGLFQIFDMEAAPTISPVIPGFAIPGLGMTIPLVAGWLALFVVIVVHEFSHGVVSKAHGIPIKSSGLMFFGPLLAAFVEPDEKKLQEAPDYVQYSMYAAGPFSNV